MILEPIFYTTLMEVVLEVTWEGHHALLYFEFAQADAALILIGQALCVPVQSEHFRKHL